jgi:hypothetical protein
VNAQDRVSRTYLRHVSHFRNFWDSRSLGIEGVHRDGSPTGLVSCPSRPEVFPSDVFLIVCGGLLFEIMGR